MDQFDKDLVEHTSAIRDAVIREHEWLFHETLLKNLFSIRGSGLELRWPGGSPPDEMRRVFGHKMICLYPVNSKLHSRGSKIGDKVMLAIRSTDLPPRVGIDWSYSIEIVRARRELYPDEPFCEFAARWISEVGCLAVFDEISSLVIKLWTKDCAEEPTQWRNLVDTTDADAFIIRDDIEDTSLDVLTL